MALTSAGFLEADHLLLLAQAAQTFSCRPSQMLEIAGVEALQVDLACAVRLWQWESAAEEARRRNRA